MTIVGINTVSDDVLRGVMSEMERLGPPKIRAIRHRGLLYAIEGTHRLEAAKRLRLLPVVQVIADDSTDPEFTVHDVFKAGDRKSVEQLRATFLPDDNIRPTFEFEDAELLEQAGST